MAFQLLSIIAGVVIFYLVLMVIFHKLFEKFFKLVFFILSALFLMAVLYFMFKGA